MMDDIRNAVVAACLVAGASLGGAATFTVTSPLDYPDASTGDGACLSTVIGQCTLRAAVQQANATPGADVISVPAGTFTLTVAGRGEDAAATGDLDVLEDLVVVGVGAAVTVVNGGGVDRVVDHLGGSLELSGVTIRGGRANVVGSEVGGGVKSYGSLVTIDACRFTDNVANQGAALFGSSTAPILVTDSLLDGNATVSGTFNPWGAAIRAEGGLSLDGSTVTGNTGQSASLFAVDAQCYSGTVSIVNSTIADNQAAALGTWNCDVTVSHTTVYGNASYGLSLGSFDNTHTRSITSTIVAGSLYSDCNLAPGAAVSFDHCLDSDDSCGLDAGAGDLPATDPQLLPLDDWGGPTPTRYPRPGASPVVDVAAAGGCPAVDQRGLPRGGDGDGNGFGGCDLGAVEAGDLLFADGFESGTADAWHAVP